MTRPPEYRKYVYVLGAGFSTPAGGPSQERVLEKVIDFPVDGNPSLARKKARLIAFLTNVLNVSEAELKHLSLEDLYTPIDRCLADRVSLRGQSQRAIEEARSCLDYFISKVIQLEFRQTSKDSSYVESFATQLVSQAKRRAELARDADDADLVKAHDPFSIISTNWDILLDNALNEALKVSDAGVGNGDYDPFGVVDYCCYVSSFDGEDRRIRSGLWSLGARGYNVKLLKIHGSMNWLQCTNCQRLFTAFDEKLVVSEKIGTKCRHCARHDIQATLRGTLVMPTFLKDFSNFQLKLVWQNASVELMEASDLIFIGYSLPHADFEFRQLLTRMVHPEARVHVVLWGDSPRFDDEKKRYKQFFAGHNPTFEPGGVQAFVESMASH